MLSRSVAATRHHLRGGGCALHKGSEPSSYPYPIIPSHGAAASPLGAQQCCSGAHAGVCPQTWALRCVPCRAVPARVLGRASEVAAVPEGRLGFLDGQRGLGSVGLSGHVVGVRMK